MVNTLSRDLIGSNGPSRGLSTVLMTRDRKEHDRARAPCSR